MLLLRRLAWAWMIIIGGLLIVPGWPPICLACGRVSVTPVDYLFGGVAIVLGAIGVYGELRGNEAAKA